MEIEPLDATFGAIVRGIGVADLDDATWAELHATWLEYALLDLPGPVPHGRRAGRVRPAVRRPRVRGGADLEHRQRAARVHSEPDDDVVKSLRGNEGWHHDSTYMPVQAKGAVFSAEIVPDDGAPTGWADMRAAYEALDDATRTRRVA